MLGALPGVVGTLQATEVLKFLLGRGESLSGRLILYDALAMEFRTLKLQRDPACPVCGDSPRISALREGEYASEGQVAEAPGAEESEFPVHLDVGRLSEMLAGPAAPVIVDVREGWEFSMGALPGAVHIPLGQLPSRWKEIPGDREVIVYCHAGIRSWDAMQFLRSHGLERVASLDGGTDAWSLHIDPTLPRY